MSAEEQTLYSEGKHLLHEEESFDSSLIQLRQTREEIKALEAERERLQERRQQLRARVTVLESVLCESYFAGGY